MCVLKWKYEIVTRPLLILALLLLFSLKSYSQLRAIGDTVIMIPSGSFIHIGDSVSYFSTDTVIWIPSGTDPLVIYERDRNQVFYDSLKARAARKQLTKKLYDFVIVTPDRTNTKEIDKKSDENYVNYTGRKIRKIEIQRLDVFGTSINNPAVKSTRNTYNMLNKTHINTLESIIRKNLLFKSGDGISPLILSDNERILRQLPYIHDARILVVPVSDEEVDIVVVTKDVYSLGASYSYRGFKRGALSVFDRNIFGIGHELEFRFPFDTEKPDSPGFGISYSIDNIARSFINLRTFYVKGLGDKSYGFSLDRQLVSSTTKYAGGISVLQMYTGEDFDTMKVPLPLSYNLQDYWVSRSFLLNTQTVKRVIIGARYINNNVFEHPQIEPDSYHRLQKYQDYLGSVAFSAQKYYKTNLIYGYGRTEDMPYGALLRITAGKEYNEFKTRTYLGTDLSLGQSISKIGYFYTFIGVGGFLNDADNEIEQGMLALRLNYFSNLLTAGRYRIRNFVNFDYSRGTARYSDEYLKFLRENGFSGFRNDSIKGTQRFYAGLESVFFSPTDLLGFRFAFYGFSDIGYLFKSDEFIREGFQLLSIGLGVRIRNDNLLFNTLQIRFAFYPVKPDFSRVTNVVVSGEQLLKPYNFDPGPPSIIPYR
ncbi:MAG: hypothetical protein A2X05_07860 [Bacteroidetes bacterium GWE2_41_25]|nr:MAG: hypothetical protein A2X03_02375 [Bacteroidetes bacterium GWA2_40_15]OFX94810.1 MAG: hypothetical protein A2X06_17075 [Bacteroidetes bacterium GWC2_40_22]OFY00463.1 MAG: hypothetical protein A2X05_07860 [Bacteroidetes bacterium GWE2_41_25]OFY60915.1 MAG: hypothetical protein A2X04_09480 [Bacteroidetes bacterium GWF2_41_9]HAM10003.1 hypothetical protein [Bacteroidales bacterium]